MGYCQKIDKSLGERYGIVNLLESLKKEDITMEEMERIGTRLQKAGRRALSPLIRKLWREENDDLINRYVYLLDFFEDEVWLDQLIRIVVTRSDLGDEGKASLLALLEDYGVDISAPPFDKVLDDVSGPLEVTLPRLLEKGEAGLVRFMEDFLHYPRESRPAIVRLVAAVQDARVAAILEILLGFDDREVVREAIISLGRMRDARAASLLRSFDSGGDGELAALAERSLRRLAFLGFEPHTGDEGSVLLPLHCTAASPIDGAGNRTVWFSRWRGVDSLDLLFMQIHETDGILDVLGYGDLTEEKYEKIIDDVASEEMFVETDPAYAVLLVADAMAMSRAAATPLPPEYYVWRRILPPEALEPWPYTPDFSGHDLDALADTPGLVAESAVLFEEEYFDGWFTAENRLFDLAEEFNAQEERLTGRGARVATEGFIRRFIDELVTPDLERMIRRLLLTADLMEHVGRERRVVEMTLAVALSLMQPRLPFQRHPFLRQYAMESLRLTREALADGFDVRNGTDDWDGEPWD